MSLPPPILQGGYPTDPSRPSPYSCTIDRPRGPGWRMPMQSPWFNAFAVDSTDGGVRDRYVTYRLRQQVAVSAGSVLRVVMGRAPKACVSATLQIDGFNPGVPPTVIPAATLYSLLVPLLIRLQANGRFFYSLEGQPQIGITFSADMRAGELVTLWLDNTNPSSLLTGQILRFQLFLYCDPVYAIEMGRKGQPGYF